ncbi:NIF3-like protein 1 isoform X1 [Malaya genurostris]|uniref:NIF3-like protein 1 isoform X1 n=2 Tax=Malaya genurostris TaxID=325434 RepID=UPI0026F40445|nr:NIF3-like protein 1 isoform X1 [Malaya genurostris]
MFNKYKTSTYLSSLYHFKKAQTASIVRKMSGAALAVVVEKLNEFAPEILAEKWDNVGLLIEPYTKRNIRKILLTNDLTENVMSEALARNADMIISYHPPIFAPLKRITQKSWKERIVSICLENKIALYSPHTSWDSVTNGVNDWLASSLPLASAQPILENLSNPSYGAGRICVTQGELTLGGALNRIKSYTNLNDLKLAMGVNRNLESPIRTFAVCAGSGTSVLKGVKADLYITGEMFHHDVLEAIHQNIHVVLLNHSNSERGYLLVFRQILLNMLKEYPSIKIDISEHDMDPLQTY